MCAADAILLISEPHALPQTFPDDWPAASSRFAVREASKPSFFSVFFFFPLLTDPADVRRRTSARGFTSCRGKPNQKETVGFCVCCHSTLTYVLCGSRYLCDRGLHQNKCAILVPERILPEKKQNEKVQNQTIKKEKRKLPKCSTLVLICAQLLFKLIGYISFLPKIKKPLTLPPPPLMNPNSRQKHHDVWKMSSGRAFAAAERRRVERLRGSVREAHLESLICRRVQSLKGCIH